MKIYDSAIRLSDDKTSIVITTVREEDGICTREVEHIPIELFPQEETIHQNYDYE